MQNVQCKGRRHAKHAVIGENQQKTKVDGPSNFAFSAPRCCSHTVQWLGDTTAFVIEHSQVDAKAKIMTTFTWNITLATYMFVREKSTYKVSPENPNWCVRVYICLLCSLLMI